MRLFLAPKARSSGAIALALTLAMAACSSGEGAPGEAARPGTRGERVHDEPTREEPASGARARTASAASTGAALPVDGARAMATLSEAESASVCAWLVVNAPHRRVECEDGRALEVGVGHDDGCPPAAAFAGCTLTVGETTACMAENARDPCAHGPFGTPVCASFRQCMETQMGLVREGPASE